MIIILCFKYKLSQESSNRRPQVNLLSIYLNFNGNIIFKNRTIKREEEIYLLKNFCSRDIFVCIVNNNITHNHYCCYVTII
jgi:predicted transcriptional regulator